MGSVAKMARKKATELVMLILIYLFSCGVGRTPIFKVLYRLQWKPNKGIHLLHFLNSFSLAWIGKKHAAPISQ